MIRPGLPRTLRGRLIAVLALALSIGFAATALATALLVRHVLLSRLDAQLEAAGNRFAVSLEYDGESDDDSADTAERFGRVEGQLAGTLGARLYGGKVTDAAIIGDDRTSTQVPLTARQRLAQFTDAAGPVTVELPRLGDYRIVVTAGRDGDLLVAGLPAEPIEHTVRVLVLAVAGVSTVALLTLVVVAASLVRVMLRPLARVSATAAVVAGLPLTAQQVSLPRRLDQQSAGSEIDVLISAFNAMLEQVESALHTRADTEVRLRRFLTDASHELRTPVAVILSHAELARREGGDSLPEGVNRSLGRITAQSQRMRHLVDDLLLLARLDNGRPLAHEPVDIVRLALEALDDARTANPGHRWKLSLPDHPVTVHGDTHALAQVLANLLTNAATHTPAGTTVTLHVRELSRRTSIEVRDDGPGMPADLVPRAFERFARGDVHRSGGSGLGLAIVAAIVQAHLGDVGLTSTDEGTTVTLTLPADSGATPGSVPAS
ncbi:HAMP domain-containing sensor histidine kinase [Kineosporia sp. NBRC 101731]|uniref:sensor histidine kinase n=1 Tax=Kineosporia sp. NBRC 101731 TaxID=3032199 RepID=UPI0024A37BCC|nr:HAMP domain-containing sensor histidine kinase [Kineosporia sp. NBRC 101731]GLY33822.1 putative two component sensor kinase [Kineosporia sp. NBRC 101731]